mgnify:CR=1 FL=1
MPAANSRKGKGVAKNDVTSAGIEKKKKKNKVAAGQSTRESGGGTKRKWPLEPSDDTMLYAAGSSGSTSKKNKKEKRDPLQKPEERLQGAAIEYMTTLYPSTLYCCSLAGMGIAAATVKAGLMGYWVGWPDLTIAEARGQYCGAYVEFKIAPKKPTSKQEETLELLRARGYCAELIYTIDDFADFIKWYMSLPPHEETMLQRAIQWVKEQERRTAQSNMLVVQRPISSTSSGDPSSGGGNLSPLSKKKKDKNKNKQKKKKNENSILSSKKRE